MSGWEIWLIAVGLAMDCFAVSIAGGILLRQVRLRPMLVMAFAFGLFQALMPFAGWIVAGTFSHLLEKIDHWIAFGLLAFLGGRMIRDSFRDEENRHRFDPTDLRTVLTLSVATSIDALAVGISFACLGIDRFTDLLSAVCIIGLVSFLLSMVGLLTGICFGHGFARRLRAELCGGVILILIGIKIWIEHMIN